MPESPKNPKEKKRNQEDDELEVVGSNDDQCSGELPEDPGKTQNGVYWDEETRTLRPIRE